MPTPIWAPDSRDDVIRLRQFIEPHNPEAARRAAESIKKAATLLLTYPGVGKRLEGRQDRELFGPFGKRGYIMRYRLNGETVIVLRIWHALEDKESDDEINH